MAQNHYRSHNQRLLQDIAGDQHEAWLKARDQRALKRAKRDVKPAKGKTLASLAELKGI